MPADILAAIGRDYDAAVAERFLRTVVEYIARARSGDGAVSTSSTPAELAARFDEPLPTGGMEIPELLARIERDIVGDANRLMHPMAMGHQVSPPLPVAIWMEPLVSAMNQSVAVWEMSPTGTPVEACVIRWMTELIGWRGEGDAGTGAGAGAGLGAGTGVGAAAGPRAGGTFTSGGTEATFTALLAARAAACPDAWRDGVGDDPPVVVCGEHVHYAVTRAVAQLGLGMRRAIAVPSRDFRMDVDALARTLHELAAGGTRVMAVVATAGSTATGSFDDLEMIGVLCEERGIWLHVDGAHGASALLSPTHRHRLRGIERASSVAWDPHKMLLMPVQAGMLLVREERRLDAAFAQRAPYLFHGGEDERAIDQGVRSFLCSRRVDAFKLWATLERYGADSMGALYDRLCDTTAAIAEELRARPMFEVLHEPECNILCFRWIGDGTRPPDEQDAINLAVRERWNRSGRGWITTTVLGGRRVLRVTVMNPATSREHGIAMLEGLEEMIETGAENGAVGRQ